MKKLLTNSIQKLPANNIGRDYIVGDLHGCLDLLERLLAEARFNPSHDRLFSVGDLVDRGAYSLQCLELLAEPWFYAVQGNHEDMLVDFFSSYLETGKIDNLDKNSGMGFLFNGGDWVAEYYNPDTQSMTDGFDHALRKVLELPLALVVGEGDGRFNIVHAELVIPDFVVGGQLVWQDIDLDLWLDYGTVPTANRENLLTGRMLVFGSKFYRIEEFERNQDGLSPVFCGHTPMQTPCRNLSHFCIDTGGCFSASTRKDYGLTLVDALEYSYYRASYCQDVISKGFIAR